MVARKFGVGIDLGGKQIKGLILENLSSNPENPKDGYIYFNTTDKTFKIYEGSVNGWKSFSTSDELEAEIARATAAETLLTTNLANEVTRATGAEETLQDNIDAEASARDAADDTLQDNIDAEATAREAADETLQDNIDAEETRATTAEAGLQDNIDAEASRATTAEGAIATDLLNLGKAIWGNYESNKAVSGAFNTKYTNQNGNISTVFNESDGGGLKYDNVASNIVSAIAVNNGGANEIAAQIYSKYKANVGDEVQNSGTRLNVNPTGIYYTKGTVTTATAGDVRNEIAVLKDIDTLESSVDAKLDLKADKATTYTKDEIDAKMSTVYDYKGTVDVMGDLPKSGNKVGDVWNVVYKVVPGGDPTDPDDLVPWGMNVAWNGTAWDELGQIIDLSPYLKIADAAATYETIANCNTIRGRLET